MTTTDVQQLQYALAKAQERNEGLSALLKASNASNDALVEMVLKHEATIARLSAERQGIAAEALRLIDTNHQYMDIMGKQTEVRDRVFASYQEAQKTNATLLRERDELAAKLAAIPVDALKCYWKSDEDGNDPIVAEQIVGEWISSL